MTAIKHLAELGRQMKANPAFREKMEVAAGRNPWFVPQFTTTAINAIAEDMLNEQALTEWLSAYTLPAAPKTIGLIFAGNVPLVGLHDFLCCYVTGHRVKIKLSSKDDALFTVVLEVLMDIDPELKNRVEIVEKLKDFDAVIATGSDNTSRYFEYYFRDYPKILRRSRNGVAVLTGNESPAELDALVDDISLYFGFGCRNVSKLYVPVGYPFEKFFPHFERYKWMHNHTKYMNNYDYNRTILLLNNTPHLANDFVMILENASIPSPISTVHFEYWHDENVLRSHLKQNAEKIQCVVSAHPTNWGIPGVTFGASQRPSLSDYADGVDTMRFLVELK